MRATVRGADVSRLFVPYAHSKRVEWYALIDVATGEMEKFVMIGDMPEVPVGDDE